MTSALNWFEIPVTDLDRAKSFYSEVLDGELTLQSMGDEGTMAILIKMVLAAHLSQVKP